MSFNQCLNQQVSEQSQCNSSIDAEYSNSLVGGSDYREIRVDFFDVLLIFDNDNRQHSFDVIIEDDSLFERDVEDFTLELRFDPFAFEPPSNVILSPNVSTVEIIDDDGKI